ncbi:MAG: hypothetical protein AB1793_01405 [Candidatus Thermoplasmatota archaeon]
MRRGGLLKGASLVLLALLLVLVVTGVDWPDGDMDAISNDDVSRAMLGDEWTSGYSLVVFMIGLLLLVAILGGVFLAKEERE